jgi:hypothetical protein
MSDRAMGFMCHTGDLEWEELISWVQEGERLGYSTSGRLQTLRPMPSEPAAKRTD